MDGEELFDDFDIPLERGRIAFSAGPTSVRFREILVTTPEGKVLWKGPPECLTDDEGKVIWQSAADPRSQPAGENQAVAERPAPKPPEKPVDLTSLAPDATVNPLPAGDSGQGAEWAYTTTKPGPDWAKPEFDDSKWKHQRIGFEIYKDRIVLNTPSKLDYMWLRAKVARSVPANGQSMIMHLGKKGWGEAVVFVNGGGVLC